jgi:threonine/homoserine/homoserine lactone efflux protein
MLRRGPFFAAVNVSGICFAQAIWAATTVAILLFFGNFYDPVRLDDGWSGLLAAAVLFYLAYRFLVANPKNDLENKPDIIQSKKQGLKQFSVGFILTLTSPQWPIAYLLVLSSFKVTLRRSEWFLIGGVGLGLLLGVILFWVLMLLTLKLVRARATLKTACFLNRLGGIAMLIFAFVALADSVWQFLNK